jgi:hypothetical protein
VEGPDPVDAGVVDQEREWAVALLDLLEEGGKAVSIRDVEREGESLAADLPGGRLGGVEVHIADGHARRGQPARGRWHGRSPARRR